MAYKRRKTEFNLFSLSTKQHAKDVLKVRKNNSFKNDIDPMFLNYSYNLVRSIKPCFVILNRLDMKKIMFSGIISEERLTTSEVKKIRNLAIKDCSPKDLKIAKKKLSKTVSLINNYSNTNKSCERKPDSYFKKQLNKNVQNNYDICRVLNLTKPCFVLLERLSLKSVKLNQSRSPKKVNFCSLGRTLISELKKLPTKNFCLSESYTVFGKDISLQCSRVSPIPLDIIKVSVLSNPSFKQNILNKDQEKSSEVFVKLRDKKSFSTEDMTSKYLGSAEKVEEVPIKSNLLNTTDENYQTVEKKNSLQYNTGFNSNFAACNNENNCASEPIKTNAVKRKKSFNNISDNKLFPEKEKYSLSSKSKKFFSISQVKRKKSVFKNKAFFFQKFCDITKDLNTDCSFEQKDEQSNRGKEITGCQDISGVTKDLCTLGSFENKFNNLKKVLKPLSISNIKTKKRLCVTTFDKKHGYPDNLKPSSNLQETSKKLIIFATQYNCDQCEKELPSLKALYYHCCYGKTKRGFLCNICKKNFDFYSVLKKHKLLHAADRVLSCSDTVKNRKTTEKFKEKNFKPTTQRKKKKPVQGSFMIQNKSGVLKSKSIRECEEKENISRKKRFSKIYVPSKMLEEPSTSNGIYSSKTLAYITKSYMH